MQPVAPFELKDLQNVPVAQGCAASAGSHRASKLKPKSWHVPSTHDAGGEQTPASGPAAHGSGVQASPTLALGAHWLRQARISWAGQASDVPTLQAGGVGRHSTSERTESRRR